MVLLPTMRMSDDVFIRCRERRPGRIAVVLFLAEHRFGQRRHSAAGMPCASDQRGHARNRGNEHCQGDRNAKVEVRAGTSASSE